MGMYPRTIAIHRQASTLSPIGGRSIAQPSQPGGRLPYLGQNQTPSANGGPGESVVATGIPASIQSKGGGATTDPLPSGAPGPIRWLVFLRRTALGDDDIQDRDVIVDDLGRRFQILSAYPHMLGWRIECIRLEA